MTKAVVGLARALDVGWSNIDLTKVAARIVKCLAHGSRNFGTYRLRILLVADGGRAYQRA